MRDRAKRVIKRVRRSKEQIEADKLAKAEVVVETKTEIEPVTVDGPDYLSLLNDEDKPQPVVEAKIETLPPITPTEPAIQPVVVTEPEKEPLTQTQIDKMRGLLGLKPKPQVEFKAEGGRRWWLFGLGIVAILIGLAGFAAFTTNRNSVIGMGAIMAIIGGGIAVKYGLETKEAGVTFIERDAKGKLVKLNANACNIYPDRIEFEEMPEDQLKGFPRRIYPLKGLYYVNIWGTAFGGRDDRLLPLKLPDTQYRDPREFANNLNIPAHRRLAERKVGLFQKIAPWIIVAGYGVVAFLWVATTKPPTP
jgi:hypothetical protein